MAHGEGTHGSGPKFDVVLRGYDRRQVDDHLTSLDGRLAATSGQCNELRLQRDAAASRVRELEQRLNGAAGVNAVTSTAASPEGQAAAASEATALDGFGAKVEAILRLATEEAAAIRKAAEESGRKHSQAEVTLRSSFESIAERLGPLAERLTVQSSAAQEALPAVTDQASSLESSAQQQARILTEAAAANAARMRADARARVEVSAQQVADVREELALVRQILSNLGGPDTGPAGAAAQPGSAGAAAHPGWASSQGPASSRQGSGQQTAAAQSGSAGATQASGQPPGPVQPPRAPQNLSEQIVPSSWNKASQPTAPQRAVAPGAAGRAADGPTSAPATSASRPPASAQNPMSAEAPTETIALPLGETSRDGAGQRTTGPSQPPT